MKMVVMQMCFQSWGMSRWLLRSYFDVSNKKLLICFVFLPFGALVGFVPHY
jgi:hypothetical protein